MRIAERGRREKRTERACLLLFLAGYLFAVLLLVFLQPMADTPPVYPNPPDEHARFLVPLYICETGRLPTGFEEAVRVPGGLNGSYAFQPMLPYIIMGYLMRLMSAFGLSGQGLVITARLVNVTSGLLTALVLYALGGRLFEARGQRFLFCTGILYLPQHLFLHSYVNTESMCMLSIALMLYALVRICTEEKRRPFSHALLAAGGILCAQTYYNAYGYLLAAGLLFLLTFFAEKNASGTRRFAREAFLRFGLPVYLAVLLGAALWFVREGILLNGDFTGIRTNNALREGIVIAPAARGADFFEMLAEEDVIGITLQSFIARFGSMSITASPRYYLVYESYLAAGLVLSLAGLPALRKASFLRRSFHLLMCFAMLSTVALWVYYIYWIDLQLQGRYVLPVLVPLYYYICKGYGFPAGRLGGRWRELFYAALIGFVVFALYHYLLRLCVPVYMGRLP